MQTVAEEKGSIVNTNDGTEPEEIRLSFKRKMIEEFQEGRRVERPAE